MKESKQFFVPLPGGSSFSRRSIKNIGHWIEKYAQEIGTFQFFSLCDRFVLAIIQVESGVVPCKRRDGNALNLAGLTTYFFRIPRAIH